jgi:hypothetical protein
MYSRGNEAFGGKQGEKLVINTSSALIGKLLTMCEAGGREETASKMAKQIYMLAVIAQRPLTSEELEGFVGESVELLESMQ